MKFTSCKTTGSGGAVKIVHKSTGTLTLSSLLFDACVSTVNGGGLAMEVYNEDSSVIVKGITMKGCQTKTDEETSSGLGMGGCLYMYTEVFVSIDWSKISFLKTASDTTTNVAASTGKGLYVAVESNDNYIVFDKNLYEGLDE